MWNGKKKAVTFSFDDGVTQDIRLIEILNKYNLKATFNINSSFVGLKNTLVRNSVEVRHDKINVADIKKIYYGHEISGHTLTHPLLTELDKNTIIYQVEKDRLALSDICGYEVVGMAYPGGGMNYNKKVADVIKNYTGVKYARTTVSSYNFDIQNDLFRFIPTVYYIEKEKMFDLATKFVNLKTNNNKLFYIWGHSYEMDAKYILWEEFEYFCKLISGKDDIFYGTNKELLF